MAVMPEPKRNAIAALISESEELEPRMAELQDREGTDPAPVRADYRDWHAKARRFLEGDAQKSFDDQRDGGWTRNGVMAYLTAPREDNIFGAGDDGSFPLGRWQYPFDQVQLRLEKQRSLLLEAMPEETPAELAAVELAANLRRLPELLRTLQRRREDWTASEAIQDESDLQVVVEGVLRVLYDDVRPEDYVPSKAGANGRVDFVLPEVSVVVETKMTRKSLTARKLGEELLVDAGRYPTHPDCEAVVALVYDPDHRLENPKGIERDLTLRTASGLSFICVVVN